MSGGDYCLLIGDEGMERGLECFLDRSGEGGVWGGRIRCGVCGGKIVGG